MGLVWVNDCFVLRLWLLWVLGCLADAFALGFFPGFGYGVFVVVLCLFVMDFV